MTKRLLILLPALAALALTNGLHAQPRLLAPEMYIGASGGVSASMVLFSPKVPGTTDVLQTAFLSGRAGLMFRYSGHKCCGIQLEVNYNQRGWRENTDTHSYTRKLEYIELPLLTHIWFGKPHFRGFVNIGPQVAFCVHESETGTRQTAEVHQYAPLDNVADWGVAGGIGFYGRSLKAGCFQFEARYTYSFGNIFSSRAGSYFAGSNTMVLSLNIAYLWQIK
jgi:hypothetical protein